MKPLKSVLFLVALNSIILAQNYYSPYVRTATPARSSGNSAQIGAGVDVNQNIGNSLKLDVDFSAVYEAKTYVGDGFSYRAQAEFGPEVLDNIWILAGGSASLHTNSQYNKVQYQPIISAHYTPSSVLDIYYTALLPAYGNNNDVKGHRAGYRGYLYGSGGKYPVFFQAEFNTITFKDAFLNLHRSSYITFGVGLAFKKDK